MSINFRKFDSNVELEVQRALFKECFPECIDTPVISHDHYNWKFHSKKGEMKSAEFTANSEKDILGYYAAIPYQYKLSGKVVNAAMVCDVMTGMKARGKGIFTQLGIYSTGEFSKQGFDFTTGYPIRKEVIPGHLKAGWEKYFELPLYGKFIKFNSFLRKRNLEFLAPLFNFFVHFINGITKFILLPRNSTLKLETVSYDSIESINGLSEFYIEWGNEIEISLIKDIEFLKWRLGAPGKSYYISILRDYDKIVGVLIACEIMKEGVPCMGVLDMALLKPYHDYANLLTNKIIELAKKNQIEMLLIMISKSWFKRYKLSHNLFIKTPFKFYLIVKKLNAAINIDILKNEKNWHLMWIDSDDL
jgi:hypothetical protein